MSSHNSYHLLCTYCVPQAISDAKFFFYKFFIKRPRAPVTLHVGAPLPRDVLCHKEEPLTACSGLDHHPTPCTRTEAVLACKGLHSPGDTPFLLPPPARPALAEPSRAPSLPISAPQAAAPHGVVPTGASITVVSEGSVHSG